MQFGCNSCFSGVYHDGLALCPGEESFLASLYPRSIHGVRVVPVVPVLFRVLLVFFRVLLVFFASVFLILFFPSV